MEKTAQATLSAPITVQGKKTDILTLRPVSYTHLTLPTIATV